MRINALVVLFFMVLGMLLAAGGPALAQEEEPSGFKNVKLWVYPEYDDPRLLVMLEGQIEGATPATVRFLVPSTAFMYSAGSMTPEYQGGPPDRKPSSVPGWDEISYQVISDTFRVEYYDPIVIGQPDKTISYDFRWLYPIADLTAVFQVPRTATDFSVSPAGTAFTESGGFTAYRHNFSSLDPADPPLHWDISYHKEDGAPSIQPASAVGAGSGMSPVTLVVLAGAAAIVAAGGFFLLRRSQPARTSRAARRQAARNAPARRDTDAPQAGRRAQRFCTGCSRPLTGSPKFCPNCGNRVG